MLVFKLGVRDVAQVRFAYSPLLELFESLRQAPARDPTLIHLHEQSGRGSDVLRALVRTQGCVPDFITPPPLPYRHPTIATELRALSRMSADVIRADLFRTYRQRIPQGLQSLYARPGEVLPDLVAAVGSTWEIFSVTRWPVIRARLEDHIALRSQHLARVGLGGQLRSLAPGVEWDDGQLHLPKRTAAQVIDLAGRGLTLVPTAAFLPEPMVVVDPPWQPAVFFSIGPSAAYPQRTDADLSELLGGTRAAILSAIATPATTSGLAATLAEDPGNVSRHLHVLNRASLASSRRYGRRVWYGQTDEARNLLASVTRSSSPASS